MRTRTAMGVLESLERCAMLAYLHTTAGDALEIAECLALIEQHARAARERIVNRGAM